MELKNLDIFIAAIALLGLLIFFIHWMTNKKPSLPNFLFRIFLLANSYYYIVAAVIKSEGIVYVPHLFRTGTIAGLLEPPLIYLIIIKSLKNDKWNRIDLLHFIPVLLYIIDFTPFFTLSTESKRQLIESLLLNDGAILGFNEAWLLNGTFWIICKTLQPLLYSVVCFITMFRIIRKSGVSFKKDNNKLLVLLYWLSVYLLINAISIALSFAGLGGSTGWEITSIIIFSSTLITCLYLLLNPEVLYGLKGIWINKTLNNTELFTNNLVTQTEHVDIIENDTSSLELSNTEEPESKVNTVRETYLSFRQVENMGITINKYMNETQAFLQQGFSLPQMAKETGFQLQHVSAFLNQHLGESFSDYTNKFRVNYLIHLFDQDPNVVNQYTFETLGKKVGFGSRSTFINAFKKNTGQTPSAYFKQ